MTQEWRKHQRSHQVVYTTLATTKADSGSLYSVVVKFRQQRHQQQANPDRQLMRESRGSCELTCSKFRRKDCSKLQPVNSVED